jgi:RNA polymerase sigma-70 factor (ECF subfamily)
MSKHDNQTTMGGSKGSFETTRWTQIQKAKTQDQERRQTSVNNLIDRYWKPIYCCLIHKGYDNEDAKDITQDFFTEIVFGNELIQKADQKKGRFRTFLKTALDRYVISVYRKETAKKRLPEHGLARLDSAQISGLPVGESKFTPELAFNYTWATNLLDQVLNKVKEECYKKNMATHWEVFRATNVAQMSEDARIPSLAELCERYGIENEKKASNMIVTVKRRFAKTLKNHLHQFGLSDSEIEEEIQELIQILSKGGVA